jgi:hypothetical protein
MLKTCDQQNLNFRRWSAIVTDFLLNIFSRLHAETFLLVKILNLSIILLFHDL